MKVSELVQFLSKFPQDAEVEVRNDKIWFDNYRIYLDAEDNRVFIEEVEIASDDSWINDECED